MPLRTILTSHLAAVLAVSIVLATWMAFEPYGRYPWSVVLALIPVQFGVAYMATFPFVLPLRRWAISRDWNGYRHAIILGAVLGSIAHGLIFGALNGAEMAAEVDFAILVLAIGAALGAFGGCAYLYMERFLVRRGEVEEDRAA